MAAGLCTASNAVSSCYTANLIHTAKASEEAPHTCGWGGQNIRDWQTPMKSDFLSYNTSYKKTD